MISVEGSGGPSPQPNAAVGGGHRRDQVSDQAPEKEIRKSRRALLAAAVGGAAAVAAQAALPLAAQAHDADDVELGAVNASATTTEIDASADDIDAFKATATGTGSAVVAAAVDGAGLAAASDTVAGAYVTSGDPTTAQTIGQTLGTGVYGFTPTSPDPQTFVGTGVWGESPDVGVYGDGFLGVEGDGLGDDSAGVVGYTAGARGVGVVGQADGSAGIGVLAYAPASNQTALKVTGKVSFSRSGRSTIGSGKSSLTVNVVGVTSSSRVFAQLASNRSGRYVRAVVSTTGKFTIYLNTTVTSASYVIWWILN
jgi:hypothetical protein